MKGIKKHLTFGSSAKLLNIPFQNKADPSIIFHDLHFLTGIKTQCLPDYFWYDDLVFRGYGYSLNAEISFNIISCYNNTID